MSGMLDGKVVVISGVGPALGTTLAHRCTGEGADLVLDRRDAANQLPACSRSERGFVRAGGVRFRCVSDQPKVAQVGS